MDAIVSDLLHEGEKPCLSGQLNYKPLPPTTPILYTLHHHCPAMQCACGLNAPYSGKTLRAQLPRVLVWLTIKQSTHFSLFIFVFYLPLSFYLSTSVYFNHRGGDLRLLS